MSDEVKASSPNQPLLDLYVKVIKEKNGEESITEAYINEANGHMPVLRINNEEWHDVAKTIRDDENMRFDYVMILMVVLSLDYSC